MGQNDMSKDTGAIDFERFRLRRFIEGRRPAVQRLGAETYSAALEVLQAHLAVLRDDVAQANTFLEGSLRLSRSTQSVLTERAALERYAAGRATFLGRVTNEEIREVLLQTAVYCGFPAAIDAFRAAREGDVGGGQCATQFGCVDAHSVMPFASKRPSYSAVLR